MTAIYKKELRSYFTSMTGYICMAFMLVVIGIYFAVINLSSGYPYFGYTLSCVIVLFLLMTPVLTMRILAEEKNRKTDQLLLTAPVSLWKIVIGKYLAMVTVFGLALLITCFYPLILSRFGTVSLPMAYTAILGYFLYGAACIAIGLFISSSNGESGYCSTADILCAACILYYRCDHQRIAVNGGGIFCYLDFRYPFCSMAGV